MVVATKQDLDKKAVELVKHLKFIDESGRLKEKKLVSMVRSAIRQVWMSAPNKLAFLENTRIVDTDPNTRTKWLWKCNMCGSKRKGADIEVDHIDGNHQFLTVDDFKNFANKILGVSIYDGMQILCKEPCHDVKTYKDKHNLPTWEIAYNHKKAIAWEKDKSISIESRNQLLSKYYPDKKSYSNMAKRRECYIELLQSGILKQKEDGV